MTSLRAAAAQVDITPPVGLPMDGYIARTGVSVGVHDPLLGQILVLEDDQQRIAIVTLDVLAISGQAAAILRARIAHSLDVSKSAVFICASHTHTAAVGWQNWFPVGAAPSISQELVNQTARRLADAGQIARSRLVPVQVVAQTGVLPELASDRNHARPALDSTVTALGFTDGSGKPVAVLFHYACHPTILGAVLEYSADFPGAARRQIQRAFPGAVVLYLNGAAGNLSTRFTRRSQTFEEMERLGGLLGEQVVALLGTARTQNDVRPGTDSRTVLLPLRTFAIDREIRPTGDRRIDQVRAEGAAIEARLAGAFKGKSSQPIELRMFHVGLWKFFGIPGEPFDELAASVRQRDPRALVVGYANAYLGYFPTQEAVQEMTYEALSSPYDARVHQLIQDAILPWLADLKA
jgi:neutral ceramidase